MKPSKLSIPREKPKIDKPPPPKTKAVAKLQTAMTKVVNAKVAKEPVKKEEPRPATPPKKESEPAKKTIP